LRRSGIWKPSRALAVTLSVSAISASAWIFLLTTWRRPVERRISSVALSRTGAWIAAGNSRGKIGVWKGWAGSAIRKVNFAGGRLNDLEFSPDERLLVMAGKNLGLYPLGPSASPRFLRSDGRNYGTARFSHDGKSLLVISGGGTIEVLDSRSGATQLNICCSTVYGEVAFTPDESIIANAGHWPALWNSRSGRLIARLTKDREFYTLGPIAFDWRRHTVLMGSQDGRVYCWDLARRQLMAISAASAHYVDTIAVSNTGLVAYAGFENVVRLWDPQSGEERSLADARPTSNLILAPDGTSILFGTADGEIELWDMQKGQRLRAKRVPLE
jgi:WD40 repeat protein